ncbi:uncharacterized protein LOC133883383 [Phragmites australis]|uniref:uncharacterized protein LOC133883383 n=1 Tax=Phragmites australis TaxID=29695 RepID=UPI002D796C09|nr:uncharacterized protein LOC133883383 [Phragmites australis]
MDHGGHHAMNHIWQRRWPHLAFARSGLHLRHTEGVEKMLLLVTVLLMRRGVLFLCCTTCRLQLTRLYLLQIANYQMNLSALKAPRAQWQSSCGELSPPRFDLLVSSKSFNEDFNNLSKKVMVT